MGELKYLDAIGLDSNETINILLDFLRSIAFTTLKKGKG